MNKSYLVVRFFPSSDRPRFRVTAAWIWSEGVVPWSRVLEKGRLCRWPRSGMDSSSRASQASSPRWSRSWTACGPSRKTWKRARSCRARVHAAGVAVSRWVTGNRVPRAPWTEAVVEHGRPRNASSFRGPETVTRKSNQKSVIKS